jgi:NADH-quinone oxidoreductase subunit L
VLALLTVFSIGAAGLYFMGSHGGWVGNLVHESSAALPAAVHAGDHAAHAPHAPHAPHGTFLGMDPHKVMYYVSGVVGFVGIGIAFALHYAGRTTAATANADKLLPKLGPIPRWAQGKWYVDELYALLIVRPLHLFSVVFAYVDKLLVDGLVNVFGFAPRGLGTSLRPLQGGNLHGYAVQMAGGVAVLLLIVFLASIAAS